MTTGRRSFVQKAFGGAIGALLLGSTREAAASPALAVDPWLEEIVRKKHRVFLDVGVFATDGGPFRRVTALMQALHDHYGASDAQIGIAFGAHGSGLGHVLTPAAWDKLGLVDLIAGSNLRAAEAQALKSGTHNWGTLGAENVAQLRQRGVKFLACRNTIGRWAGKIAAQRGTAAPEVVAEIVAGLHAGVEPVPAMIAAAVVAQARQLSYVTIA
jgi:intracellular sulfur oxidation DsrE/DsrF family protein